MQQDQPLQVARCTKIITAEGMEPRYMINVKQFAKFVVDLADTVAPTDIEVEEKPDVTYADVGGRTEHIEKLREVVETLLLHPERFVNLGIDPPKGVLLYGPPGTGKTLCARPEAELLVLNSIAILNRERFLKKIGFDAPVHSFDGSEGSVKNQIIRLILAVQTVMRMPLIGINVLVIIFKLLLG